MNDIKLANPSPLGLMGFGMTTILLNIHNAGLGSPYNTATANTVIAAMGIFCGGLAQVIAGILEFRRGNTFSVTAFTSYGFFWLTLVASWYLPATSNIKYTNMTFLGIYLAVWGIFTLFMFIGSLKANRALQFVFASLALSFFLLAAHNIMNNEAILSFAGYEGIVCGASAIYLAMADVINEQFGRIILPIGSCEGH